MRIGSVIMACAAFAVCGASRAADPLPKPVAFLTDGLATPYFSAMQLARLTQICATKFSQQCRSADVRQEDLESVDPAVFERVTVLGSPAASSIRFEGWEEFVHRFAEKRSEFLREYLAYETALFPRIGAVYAMCSGPDAQYAGLLETIHLVNFGRYWSLPADAYKRTLGEIEAAQARYLSDIRKQWSQAECVQARDFAFDLIRLFSSKLRPYLDDDWVTQGKGLQTGAGVVSIWYFGMRAEGAVHPGAFTGALDSGPKVLR